MRRLALSAGCAWLLAALGCAASKSAEDLAAQFADTADGADAGSSRNLRLDVYPSSWSYPELSPQTFTFTGDDWTGLELELAERVPIEGVLTGFDVTRAAEVSAPGEAGQPIDGRFVARLPGTVVAQSYEVTEGVMRYEALPAAGYQLAWIPAPDLLLPFALVTDASLARDSDISMDLSFGLPVYGAVTNEDQQPLPGIQIRAIDPATGLAGEPVSTDADGRYQLRVFEGSYTLEVSGGPSTYYLPTLSLPLEVGGEGLEQDIQYATTESHNVTGQIFDSDGRPLQNVIVRFTARDLEERYSASLQTESETDANGLFTVRVVSGAYTIEYIPDYDSSAGPLELRDLLHVDGNLDLEPVTLADRLLLSARVLTDTGRPVSDALIQAQEIGFDHYVYAAQTDGDGALTLAVPDTPLRWTIVPPAEGYEDWAITLLDASPAGLMDRDVTLVRGERIQGCVAALGVPLTFTPVDLRDGSGALYTTATTDEQGCFDVRLDTEDWLATGDTADTGGTDTGGTDTGGGADTGGTGTDTAGTGTAGTGTDTAGTDTAGTDTDTAGTGTAGTGTDTAGTDTAGTGTDTAGTDTAGTGTDTAETGTDTGGADAGDAAAGSAGGADTGGRPRPRRGAVLGPQRPAGS